MENIEGFGDSGLRAIALAQKESKRLGLKYVGTGHLLLGLIGTGPELANLVLLEFGVKLHHARRELENIKGRGLKMADSDCSYTPNAKRIVQDLAKIEAAQFGNPSVRTEHILLALLQLEHSTAIRLLEALDVDLDALRKRLLAMIAKGLEGEPPLQIQKSKCQEVFDRFNPEAKRVVMYAQEKAKTENQLLIDTNTILYGLLSLENNRTAHLCLNRVESGTAGFNWQFQKKANYGTTLQNLEVRISRRAMKIIEYAGAVAAREDSAVVTPEHLLFALVCWSDLARQIIDSSGADVPSIEQELCEILKLERSFFPEIDAESRKKDSKTLVDWFNPDARRTIQNALESARLRKSNSVSIYDLHLALSDQITDLPPQFFTMTAPTAEFHVMKNIEKTQNFSPEVLSVFVEAQKRSGTRSVTPKDLLIGYLSLAMEGKITGLPNMATGSWKDLRNKVIDSEYAHYKSVEILPFQVTEHTIRMTGRLRRVLVNAKYYMVHCRVGKIGINHLVSAVLDEADNSEVEFVKNRESELREARAAVLKLKSDRRASRELLKDILERSVSNAKRLNSNRLDIHHLALALLDENHLAVNIVLMAVEGNIGTERAAKELRLRLERCLLHQIGHPRQSEPGELLDLANVYGSI